MRPPEKAFFFLPNFFFNTDSSLDLSIDDVLNAAHQGLEVGLPLSTCSTRPWTSRTQSHSSESLPQADDLHMRNSSTSEVLLPGEVSEIRPGFELTFFLLLFSWKRKLSPTIQAPPPEHKNFQVLAGDSQDMHHCKNC